MILKIDFNLLLMNQFEISQDELWHSNITLMTVDWIVLTDGSKVVDSILHCRHINFTFNGWGLLFTLFSWLKGAPPGTNWHPSSCEPKNSIIGRLILILIFVIMVIIFSFFINTSMLVSSITSRIAFFLPYPCQFHVPWASYPSHPFLFVVLRFEFLHVVAIASFDISVGLFELRVRGFQGNFRSCLLSVGTLFRKGNKLKVTLKHWSRECRVCSQSVASQFPDNESHVLEHKCAYCWIQVCVGFCCNRIFSYLWRQATFCEKHVAGNKSFDCNRPMTKTCIQWSQRENKNICANWCVFSGKKSRSCYVFPTTD